MSVLATLTDIKIPYPTEGIIRTAQLDDTVAPGDSAQLAVNMNFDRVGAIQTRPGVTQYADDLVAQINNFGTLRNSIVPPGFDFIFQFGSINELSPNEFRFPSAVKVNDTKIIVFWADSSNHGFAQNFSIDQAVGSASPLGSAFEFESVANTQNKAILVTTDIVLNVWEGVSNAAQAMAFNVSGDNVVAGAAYNFDSVGFNFALSVINSTHVICFYGVTSGNGIATVFAINLTTLAVTEPGSDLTFDTGGVVHNSVVPHIDSFSVVRALNFWSVSGVGKARIFSINTSTWAITGESTALSFGTNTVLHNAIAYGDGEHFIDIFQNNTIFLAAQAFDVNNSTYAVTTVGTALPATQIATTDLTAARFDGTHYVAFFNSNTGSGAVQMIAMTGAFVFSFIGNQLSGYDLGNQYSSQALPISSTEVMLVWGGFTSQSGKAAYFKPYGTVVNGRWLYASAGDTIYNTTTGTWVSRRSGLAQVSKPRFSQYLNYIWMVNGNAQIGGNPVATSNGGAFGSDLVPANFPPGDFIHAGFEGRVWVANKTLGILYYTDIVQFVPPTTYILSYNPDINYISELAPQTGESFTALFEVPRALLVFTQNTITRVYGATSVDAYPAYNVGTFSQESIIQTKTGIFFHHSSGFYQFDYGSQPVEISRRIIDFVKAIPRTGYDNITGVWDGFDNVEWAIGQVTVEGVVFANAYVRYTISTQVWTIYDYAFATTAMIYYDDGTNLNHLAGTSLGKTGTLDMGVTDFGLSFYFEYIDRWRAFTEMYYQSKSISGMNVYSENAGGANVYYQVQKTGPNAWKPIFTIDEDNNSLSPNSGTDSFDVIRLRIAGNTKGAPVVIHGIEITSLTILGQDAN